MLNAEEFKTKLNEVLENASDPGKVSLILTELQQNYGEVMTEQGSLTEQAAKLKETNDSLIKSNGELFRHVGLFKEPAEEEKKEEEPEDKNNLLSIEDVMEKILPIWGAK